MSKIGISLKIDVTKIDKSRLFQGAKGKYLDLTCFIDLNQQDQYGNNGFISQSVTKEEREQNIQTPILGNTKVFFNDSNQTSQGGYTSQQQASQQQGGYGQQQPAQSAPIAPAHPGDFDDDIPFR